MHPTRVAYFTEQLKATPEEIREIEQLDPTSTASNGVWLLKGIREKWFTDLLKEDRERGTRKIREALLNFQRLKDSPRLKEAGYSSDLNTYGWENLDLLFTNYWELLSNKQRARNPKGCEIIFDKGPWKVYRAFEPQAAVALGSNTSWCTNNLSTCADYLSRGNLWIYRLLDEPYAQLHVPTSQFQNKFNRSVMTGFLGGNVIADSDLDNITSVIARQYTEVRNFENTLFPLPGLSTNLIAGLLERGNPNLIRRALPLFDSRKKDLEKLLFTSGKYGIQEFHNLISYFSKIEADEELEGMISKGADPIATMAYIFALKRSRWEEVEKVLEVKSGESEYNKLYKKYISKYVGVDRVSITTLQDVNEWISAINTPHEGLLATLKGLPIGHLNHISWSELSDFFVRIKRREPEIEDRLVLAKNPGNLIAFFEGLAKGGLDIHPLPEALIEALVGYSIHSNGETLNRYVKVFFKENPEELFKMILDSRKILDSHYHQVASLYWNIVGTDNKCEWLEELLEKETSNNLRNLDTNFLDYLSKHKVSDKLLSNFYDMLEGCSPYHLRNYFFGKCLEKPFQGFDKILEGAPFGYWTDNLRGPIIRKIICPEYVEILTNKVFQSTDPWTLLGWSLELGQRLPKEKEELALKTWTNRVFDYYEKFFPEGERLPLIESFLIRGSDTAKYISYTRKVGRIPEMEEAFLKWAAPKEIYWYAEDVLCGYFPEGLPRLNTAYRVSLHETRRGMWNRLERFNPAPYPVELAEDWNLLRDGLILQTLAGKTTYRAYLDTSLVTEDLQDLVTDPKWIQWRKNWLSLTEEEKKKVWFPRVKKVAKEK